MLTGLSWVVFVLRFAIQSASFHWYAQVPGHRGGLRRNLAGEREWIGLLSGEPAGSGDVVLVAGPRLDPGDEAAPDAGGTDWSEAGSRRDPSR